MSFIIDLYANGSRFLSNDYRFDLILEITESPDAHLKDDSHQKAHEKLIEFQFLSSLFTHEDIVSGIRIDFLNLEGLWSNV